MTDSRRNYPKKKGKKSEIKKKANYWDSEPDASISTYPQLGQATFAGFLGKIAMGLLFSFIPALIFSMLFDYAISRVWSTAMLIISGIYFLAAGWSDLSKTSAKKSHERYLEKIEITQNRDEKFKFDLGVFQFGALQEDIGAAISLLAIAVIVSSLPI